MLKLRSLWSWCWEEIVELKIKLLKLTGKQCWHWDRFVELGIKLLVLIGIFIVEFCYNLATIERQLNTLSSNKQHATHAKGWHLGMSKRLHVATQKKTRFKWKEINDVAWVQNSPMYNFQACFPRGEDCLEVSEWAKSIILRFPVVTHASQKLQKTGIP